MENVFKANREKLMQQLQGGIIVIAAYTQMQRGNDMAFAFEQESNFWWLTGIEEPDWWLIMDGTRRRSWLVRPVRDAIHEVFDGSLSPDEARMMSGADEIIVQDEGLKLLRHLAAKHSVVYGLAESPYAQHHDFSFNPAPKKLYDLLVRTFASVRDCRRDIARLRAIKQPWEIARMKKAINHTITGFQETKGKLSKFAYEYEIEAALTYHFRSHGMRHAYDPIVATGQNTCTLHYPKNSDRLKKRELLLLDVGAKFQGYCADISRTWAYGEPTKRQHAVHRAVQQAHEEIIKLLKPDILVEDYQRHVDRIMRAVLKDLALLKDENDQETYRKYFPHAISHGLGIDPHDSLGAPRVLKPGMVLTVEPGVYIAEEGIGVRIEDDILITPTGHVNLSARLSTEL